MRILNIDGGNESRVGKNVQTKIMINISEGLSKNLLPQSPPTKITIMTFGLTGKLFKTVRGESHSLFQNVGTAV